MDEDERPLNDQRREALAWARIGQELATDGADWAEQFVRYAFWRHVEGESPDIQHEVYAWATDALIALGQHPDPLAEWRRLCQIFPGFRWRSEWE